MFFFRAIFLARLLGLLSSLMATACDANTYWVSPQGSNNNDCLTEGTACASVRQAVSLANTPGDVVNILSGLYLEGSDAGKDVFFNIPVAIRFSHSGTQEKPIVVQAAPGHEGRVIIDTRGEYIPFMISGHDYITIKDLQIKNAHTVGIVSRGKTARVADERDFSVGISILNNYIYNTVSKSSNSNAAAIKADNSKDWQIINNRIERVTVNGRRDSHANGIMGFNLWNNTITNNKISDAHSGILWKDHNVLSDDGVTIRYHHGASHMLNEISNVDRGISIITMGNRSDEASNHIIRQNIFYDFDIGILVNMSNALHSGQNLLVEHNVFDGTGHKKAICSSNDSMQNQQIKANIFLHCLKYTLDLKKEGTGHYPTLTATNYNIFTHPFKVNVDRLAKTSKTYKSLDDWKTASGDDFKTLAIDRPDADSIMVDLQPLFINAEAHDYRHADKSAALDLVPGGDGSKSNVGPYIKGDEQVGVYTDSWLAEIN